MSLLLPAAAWDGCSPNMAHPDVSLSQIVQQYLDYLAYNKRYSKHTIDAYRRDIQRLVQTLDDHGHSHWAEAQADTTGSHDWGQKDRPSAEKYSAYFI